MSSDSTFLNVKKTVSGLNVVNAENPVNWLLIGRTLATSFIVGVTAGITGVVESIGDAIELHFRRMGAFIGTYTPNDGTPDASTGLIGETIGTLVTWTSFIWDIDTSGFGLLETPVNILIVLLALWFVVAGARKGYTALRGGR